MNKNIKLDETNYIVGIDLGQSLVKVSYLDQITLKPVVYDLSGGYKETAVPFCLQYIKTEKDWLIGHDVKANISQEDTYVIDNVFELLLKNESVKIDGEVFSVSQLLTVFLKKIVVSFKHLNPKAKITALTVSVTDCYFEQLKEIIKESIENLDVNEVYINMSSVGLLYDLDMKGIIKNNLLLIRYEAAFLTYIIIDIKGNNANIYTGSFDESLALNKIEQALKKELMDIYKEHMKISFITEFDELNINQLLEQSFVLIFQKYAKKQSIKLYYNFAFPPFQSKLTYGQIKVILTPFIDAFKKYIGKLNEENRLILLDGPGFKMLWPQTVIKEILKEDTINVFDSVSKGNCLEGASQYIELHKWKIELKAYENSKYFIAYNNSQGTKELIPLDVNIIPFSKPIHEQLFIVDFEEEYETKLSLVSEIEKGEINVEDELIVKRVNDNRYLRINLLIDFDKEKGPLLTAEYLPL